MSSRAVGFALVLLGCGAGGAPQPATAPVAPPPAFTRTAGTLAAGACAQLEDRIFSLASGTDGVVDLFVLVKTCAAHAERDDVVLAVDAYSWLAVDRDLGAVSVREFVHVTLRAELRLTASIAYVSDHAEVTLTARPGAKIEIEPVGILEVEALNWASLLALELAPSAGESPEALAKTRLREEAQAAMRTALAEPIRISYDGRTGETWFGGAGRPAPGRAASTRVAPMRVVRRGMALSTLLEPSSEPREVRVRAAQGVVSIRAVCRSLAERMLESDRRGEPVGVDDWAVVDSEASPASVRVPPMPCAWTVAARTAGERASLVTIDVPDVPPSTVARQPDRWIAFDVLRADLHDAEVGPVTLEIASTTWRRELTTKSPSVSNAIVVASPDEGIWLRAHRPGAVGSTPLVPAPVRLPLDDAGDVDVTLPVDAPGGARLATLTLRARVRVAQ